MLLYLCILCYESYSLDFVLILPYMAESSLSCDKAIWKNKTVVECLTNSNLPGLISWGNWNRKIINWKKDFFCKYWKRLVIKNKKHSQLFIGYKLDKYILKIFKKIVCVILFAIESLLYLTPSQAKGKFLYPLKHQLVKKVHAQLNSTFLFISIIITKLLSACQITLTVCFRNWKISYTNIEFWWLTFSLKSGHSNERVCCKPISRKLKTLLIEGSGSFFLTKHARVMFFQNQFCCFLDGKKTWI